MKMIAKFGPSAIFQIQLVKANFKLMHKTSRNRLNELFIKCISFRQMDLFSTIAVGGFLPQAAVLGTLTILGLGGFLALGTKV